MSESVAATAGSVAQLVSSINTLVEELQRVRFALSLILEIDLTDVDTDELIST